MDISATPPKLIRSADVTSSILPDGTVVLVCDQTNWAHTLSSLAAIVWEFCDGENSADDIVDQIKAIKELPPVADLKEQVLALVQELLDASLVEPVEESNASISVNVV